MKTENRAPVIKLLILVRNGSFRQARRESRIRSMQERTGWILANGSDGELILKVLAVVFPLG